jgi:hypothetical protein
MLFGVLMLAAASLVVTLPARAGRRTAAPREGARRGATAGVRELRRDPRPRCSSAWSPASTSSSAPSTSW